MREILFRGKRVDNDEWVYGFLIKMWGQYHIIDQNDEDSAYMIKPETIGQYTGIRAEQGVRIFEGDILKVSYDDRTAYTTEVSAYGSTLCVDVDGEDYDFTAIDFAVDIWKNNCCEWKVVGNVYDKQEEEKKDETV